MPDWVKDLLPYISSFGGVVVGFYMARNTKALAIRDATIDHLKLLLEDSRNVEARIKAEKEAAQNQYEDKERRAAIDRDKLVDREAEIAALTAKIIDLNGHIESHPPLVWWNGVYKEAGNKDTPRWFCAECWDRRSLYSELAKNPRMSERFGACKNENCSKFNVYQ